MKKKRAKRRVTRAKSGAAKDLSVKGRSVRGGRENQVFQLGVECAEDPARHREEQHRQLRRGAGGWRWTRCR